MWTCCNMARAKKLKYEKANCLIMLASYGLHIDIDEVKSDSLWTLYYASENSDENLEYLVFQNEIMVKVIDMLKDKIYEVFVPAIRVIGNVLSSHDHNDMISRYIGLGLLDNLNEISQSASTGILKELLWVLSNLMAGSPVHINAVI